MWHRYQEVPERGLWGSKWVEHSDLDLAGARRRDEGGEAST